jgi:hypothetical protein
MKDKSEFDTILIFIITALAVFVIAYIGAIIN